MDIYLLVRRSANVMMWPAIVVSQPAVIVEIHDLREGNFHQFFLSAFDLTIYQFALCIVPLRRLV